MIQIIGRLSLTTAKAATKNKKLRALAWLRRAIRLPRVILAPERSSVADDRRVFSYRVVKNAISVLCICKATAVGDG